ncbi:MAG: nitrilase-related carbon-nitrogen hydrolase [Coriobacteriales bacterium]|jgi:predicted amidohydrolase
MSRYENDKDAFIAEAQPVDGPFAQAVDAIAREEGLWIVYTMNELNPEGLPFNTAVITDPDGIRRAAYRKVHLFESANVHESERIAAGSRLCDPVETPFGMLSAAICYDVRFPEVARAAARRGCTLLVYPAAWFAGPGKRDQWLTLLKARALENEMFVAGACRGDEGYCAASAVFGPDGTLLASAGDGEELVICELDTDAIARMRQAIPVLDHLRDDVY